MKNNSKYLLFFILGFLAFALYSFISRNNANPKGNVVKYMADEDENEIIEQTLSELSIESLRKRTFPGSKIVVEETLSSATGYDKYIVSYMSDGNRIYALMTIPTGVKPESGWPVVVFNHGYIPPAQYRTTERYVAYQDAFAKAGYITFKSDYRGHGSSEGEPSGAYGSDGYTIDVLNAVSSLKKDSRVDIDNIGMWGHSMGGYITLRSMVTTKDIKVGVIWAGVVGSHAELLNNWRRRSPSLTPRLPTGARRWRDELVESYGTPEKNPKFWDSISATSYMKDISGPVQIHHGTKDTSVPIEFARSLEKRLKDAEKNVELNEYLGDDHNLSQSFSTAIQRSVEFFDRYLK